MEIPIKNSFISTAIKNDKTFCKLFNKANKLITLSSKNDSSFSQIKDFKNNYDYSSIFSKSKRNNKLLKTSKNFSNLFLIKSYNNNSCYTNKNKLSKNINSNMNMLPKLFFNNIKLNNSQNSLSNENRKINLLISQRLKAFNITKSSFLSTKNSEKKNNSFTTKINKSLNIQLLPLNNKIKSNQYLNENKINRKINLKKNLLVKLNSLNNPDLNNYFWQIQNYKKIPINKYMNKYK